MSFEPITAIASGINSTIKIFEVSYQLKAVGEQTTDLLRTTEHVNRNVNEARRLRRQKTALISNDERIWMDRVIEDTEKALHEVAHLIEPARVDAATQDYIGSRNKILWVFRDSPKVRDKHNRLSICHQSLMTVVGGLYAKDVVVVTPMQGNRREDEPPPYNSDMEAMLNWRRKRTRSTVSSQSSETTSNPSASVPPSPSFSLTAMPSLTDVRLQETTTDAFAKEALDIYNQARLSFTEPPRRFPMPHIAATSDAIPKIGQDFQQFSLRSLMKFDDMPSGAHTNSWPHRMPLSSHPPHVPSSLPIPTGSEFLPPPTRSEPFDVTALMESTPSFANNSINEYRVRDIEIQESRAGTYPESPAGLEVYQPIMPEPQLPPTYVPSRRKKDRGWLAYTVARSDVGHSPG